MLILGSWDGEEVGPKKREARGPPTLAVGLLPFGAAGLVDTPAGLGFAALQGHVALLMRLAQARAGPPLLLRSQNPNVAQRQRLFWLFTSSWGVQFREVSIALGTGEFCVDPVLERV